MDGLGGEDARQRDLHDVRLVGERGLASHHFHQETPKGPNVGLPARNKAKCVHFGGTFGDLEG